MTPNIHLFTTEEEAYDASQTRNDIKDGDLLVVTLDSDDILIATLVSAWPTVIFSTCEPRELHKLEAGQAWETFSGGKYMPSVQLAQRFILHNRS